MAAGRFVQLTLVATVVWAGAGAEYRADHYSEDEYDSGGGGESGGHSGRAPVDTGFVTPLDFSPLFQEDNFGLASQPIAAAFLQADKSQYPALFDTAVASSIDKLYPHNIASPNEKIFSPENFGFRPVVSQGWQPAPAKYVQPKKQQQQQLQNLVEVDRNTAHLAALRKPPLQYNFQTHHDPNYRVYKSEDDLEGTEILAALKKNPAVASYFTPQDSNIEIAHPQYYRREDDGENDQAQNYRANAYLAGSAIPASRTRRYTDGKQKHRRHRQSSEEEEEEDSPYDYKSDYSIRPKEFDSGPYSSYTDGRKKKNDDYGYDYDYSNDDYERIKKLSEAQAAEIKENPENCQAVKKDSMTCMVCKNPKTGGNYESCSYVAEPKSNQYAYSREKKFDSKDAPEEAEDSDDKKEDGKSEKLQKEETSAESSETPAQSETVPKYKSTYRPPQPQTYAKYTSDAKQPYHGYKRAPSDEDESLSTKYKYSPPPPPRSSPYTEGDDDDDSEEKPSKEKKSYDYKAAIPEFYTDNEPKKDVEHVLAEFKKKDRSACKKVHKNGMTCYQCIDANGLKHEECMFVQESSPKRSHLAYQELKEFTSKPATLDGKGNVEGAESQIVTTATPPTRKSAAYVVAPKSYGTKLKRKKFNGESTTATVAPVRRASRVRSYTNTSQAPSPTVARVARSSEGKDGEEQKVLIPDETGIAPSEEFAGEASKGAFWAETQPQYSPTLGVSLPSYMLSPSEHELSFDETVAGG